MKYRLPIRLSLILTALPAALAAVIVCGQTPIAEPTVVPAVAPLLETAASAAPKPLPQPQPDALLEQAVSLLARRRSVSAKLRYQAELFGQSIVGAGDYAQGTPSSRLMRYELRMKIGEHEVHQLHINDGRYLWQQRQYRSAVELERIDVERVLATEQGSASGGDALAAIGLGGLGRLLTSLRKDFVFQKVFQSKLDGVTVYGLEGSWRPEVLQQLGVDSAQKLRPHVPDRVVLYLGCEDFFPYRLEYRREGSSPSGSLLVLELFEVRFDVPVDDAQFRFNAGSQSFVDTTDKAMAARTATP